MGTKELLAHGQLHHSRSLLLLLLLLCCCNRCARSIDLLLRSGPAWRLQSRRALLRRAAWVRVRDGDIEAPPVNLGLPAEQPSRAGATLVARDVGLHVRVRRREEEHALEAVDAVVARCTRQQTQLLAVEVCLGVQADGIAAADGEPPRDAALQARGLETRSVALEIVREHVEHERPTRRDVDAPVGAAIPEHQVFAVGLESRACALALEFGFLVKAHLVVCRLRAARRICERDRRVVLERVGARAAHDHRDDDDSSATEERGHDGFPVDEMRAFGREFMCVERERATRSIERASSTPWNRTEKRSNAGSFPSMGAAH